VFDDDFTTVEYLWKMTVPPHWAELVCSSAEIQLYTKHQATTWQSLPELDKEVGDFSYEQMVTAPLLKVVRELILNLFNLSTMCKTIGCLFWTSQCKLNKRSIIHLQQIPTPKTYGKCHQLLILIPVVYIVLLEQKYSSVGT
jgi:hypothetical protein